MEDPDLLTLEQAKRLIGDLMERQRQGWCSIRQAAYLWRRGLNPRVSKEKASWAIGKTKANYGRPPLVVRQDRELQHGREEVVLLK